MRFVIVVIEAFLILFCLLQDKYVLRKGAFSDFLSMQSRTLLNVFILTVETFILTNSIMDFFVRWSWDLVLYQVHTCYADNILHSQYPLTSGGFKQ